MRLQSGRRAVILADGHLVRQDLVGPRGTHTCVVGACCRDASVATVIHICSGSFFLLDARTILLIHCFTIFL